MAKEKFGILPSGQEAYLYTISCGELSAAVTNCGAALVQLMVPDKEGNLADVVLGYDDAMGYYNGEAFIGATVGRNANRVAGSCFEMGGKTIRLTPNENGNNLHSGPDSTQQRLWEVVSHTHTSVTFRLESPDGDQGFPGNATIDVTYSLEPDGVLSITYDAVSDQDTVFNLTNHSYFNLAGHEKTELAMKQTLQMNATFFTPDDAQNIPTGEKRKVNGTPFDFRKAKALEKDIGQDYEPLILQGGYDHNFEAKGDVCAVLTDPVSGRSMGVSTDCPGIQVYTGNFLDEHGKDDVYYGKRTGVALETQFYPDSVNHPEWPQPFVKAGEKYHSVTKLIFG